MKTKNPQNGFSLVETIVYVAIFSLFVYGMVSFSLNMNKVKSSNIIVLEVNDQSSRVINLITYTVRGSSSVTVPSIGNSGSTLTVNTDNPATNPTTFYLQDGIIYTTEGVNPAVALTNDKIKITNLVFQNISEALKPATIRVRFTASDPGVNSKTEDDFSSDFYGTATLRK